MIHFRCKHCHGQIEVDDDRAGGRVVCPHCEGALLVPTGTATVVDLVREPVEPGPPPGVRVARPVSDDELNVPQVHPIEGVTKFRCDQCHNKIAAPPDLAGSAAICPHCQAAITVPGRRAGDLEEGMVVDGFRIGPLLGRGAMGEVYLAHQLSMDREVAFKVLRGSQRDADDVEAFRREVRTLARLEHLNLVTAFEAGQFDGNYYLAMTYVDGPDLDERLDAEGRLEEKEALHIAIKVASALEHAWDRFQLLHRDIKPSNIMINSAGDVKLMDLGISTSLAEAHHDQQGFVIGTPYYMSPEQAYGQPLDQRSDIYSLGATLFHLVTGQVPFDGDDSEAVLVAVRAGGVVSPRERNPELSEHCDGLIRKMMAPDPNDRYSNWPELAKALRRVARGRPPAGGPHSGAMRRPRATAEAVPVATVTPLPKKKGCALWVWIVVVVAILLIILALLVGVIIYFLVADPAASQAVPLGG